MEPGRKYALELWDLINRREYIDCPINGEIRQLGMIKNIQALSNMCAWPPRSVVEWPDHNIRYNEKFVDVLIDAFDKADRWVEHYDAKWETPITAIKAQRERIAAENAERYREEKARRREEERRRTVHLRPHATTDRDFYLTSGYVYEMHEPEVPDIDWDLSGLPKELRNNIRSAIKNEGKALDEWIETATDYHYNQSIGIPQEA